MSLSTDAATTTSSARSIAANLLVAVVVLALSGILLVDLVFFAPQWNAVSKLIMFGFTVVLGVVPVAAAIIAVALRPYWATFVALGLVGAGIVGMIVVYFSV